MDIFCWSVDEKLTNKGIKIENIQDDKYGNYQRIRLEEHDLFQRLTAICQLITEKGSKTRWTFKFDEKPSVTNLLIGIVDDESTQKSEGEMDDFSEPQHGGYGYYISSGLKYHGDAAEAPFEYARKFVYEDNHLITMKLDLTQEKNKHGILSCVIHSKLRDGIDIDQYSNVLWDDIDINKKWRAAVAISDQTNDIVSLLPFLP